MKLSKVSSLGCKTRLLLPLYTKMQVFRQQQKTLDNFYKTIHPMEGVNVFSLVLATLTPMTLGTLYYSKMLFGKAWMDSIGMTEEKQKEANMPVVIGVSLIMSFLLAFFLFNFCNSPGQEGEFDTFKHGAWHGGFLAIVVAIPVLVSNGLFERKSWKNILINGLYWLITLIVMGGILDAMNHLPNV